MSLACGDYKAASGSELFRRQEGKTEKKTFFLSFWTTVYFVPSRGVDLLTTPLSGRQPGSLFK